MLVALLLAALLRLANLGEWPPGLYRDEAANGLDALGVLHGNLQLFFTANNGREPIYIYLVALAVAVLGRSVLAVRLPAALVGIITTVPTYLLGKSWFGMSAGVFAALVWAITFWPIHLSRIGLRAIVLAPLLASALWLGTRAYRTGEQRWWLAAGMVYGLSFYSYLAVRFTPLFLLAVAVYLVLTGRKAQLWAGGRSLWFVAGTALVVAPLGMLALADPAILLGRTGQVSVLSPTVNGGDLVGTLTRQTAAALGMFIWRGDPILRHNAVFEYGAATLTGRPVFDLFLAGPFLLGVVWCVWQWRRPAAATLLLWQLTMLGPTILAADTPHFLRAAGLLPGVVFLPAIGLDLLWRWERLPVWLRRALVVALLAGSLMTTIRTYAEYGQEPDVGFLFEDAAAELGTTVAATPDNITVYMDQRFPEGWPSILFLAGDRAVELFSPDDRLLPAEGPTIVYAWPYDPLDALADLPTSPGVLTPTAGPLARGDLEPAPYSLYTEYAFTPGQLPATRADNFANLFRLRDAQIMEPAPGDLVVTLHWDQPGSAPPVAERPDTMPTAFVHVVGPDGAVLAQNDAPLANGLWPAAWWATALAVTDTHTLHLPEPLDPASHRIVAGLYWPQSSERLPLLDSRYNTVDDQTTVWP